MVSLMQIGRKRQTGFTYIALLVAIALFGIASVGTSRAIVSIERAEREAELLYVGHEFQAAIRSYLEAGQGRAFPQTLDDLVLDRRFPMPRRHIRRIFHDPITAKPEWGLVLAPEGGIMGVHSLSEREPQKRANFEPEDAAFAQAVQGAVATKDSVGLKPVPENVLKAADGAGVPRLQPSNPEAGSLSTSPVYSYRDWKFVYRPVRLTQAVRSPARQQ